MDKLLLGIPHSVLLLPLVVLAVVGLVVPLPPPSLADSGAAWADDWDDDDDADESMDHMSDRQREQIRESIVRSLGLTHVPDVSQVHVTEEELAEAYRMYYQQLQESNARAQTHQIQKRDAVEGSPSPVEIVQPRQEDEEDDEDYEDYETPTTQQVFSFEPQDLETGVREMLPGTSFPSASFPLTMNFSVDFSSLGEVSSLALRLFKVVVAAQNASDSPAFATLKIFWLKEHSKAHRHHHHQHRDQPTWVASQKILVRGDEWETIDLDFLLSRLHDLSPSSSRKTLSLVVQCSNCGPLALALDSPENATEPEPPQPGNGTGSNASVVLGPRLDVRVLVASSSPETTMRRRRWTGHPSTRPVHTKPSRSSAAEQGMSTQDQYQSTGVGTTDCAAGKGGKRGKCCRHRMWVNFTQLNMSYVIHPKKFQAYYCTGKCAPHYYPAHTHSLIQSAMHIMRKAPRPCCAPTKLSNIVLMYKVNNKINGTHIAVRTWTNAVVEECACA